MGTKKDPRGFEKLLTKNVSHIHEKILLYLDYDTFKNCQGVCKAWDDLLTSEAFVKKAKPKYYYEERRKKWKNKPVRENFELTRMCEFGNTDKVRQLLSNGVNPNCSPSYFGTTPLRIAAVKGHKDIVEMLLDAGIDPDREDGGDQTPLMFAAGNGRVGIVKLLLEAGANPNRADDTGTTPLHKASYFGQKEIAQMLIDAGADINRINDFVGGRTPLKWAVYHGHQDVVELLRNAGADENI